MKKTKPDLTYAFGLPPERAIEYFKAKGYEFSWDWHDVWQESHAKVFTVAKAMRLDVLQDIRGMVQKALDEGITLERFQRELKPRLMDKGWWGRKIIGDAEGGQVVQLGSPRRLQTIYQANMQSAYMAGRYREMMENVADRPYWQYVAVLDSKTRPAHRRLHGKVFRYDDSFWRSFCPPNGWNCRCRVRALSAEDVKARGFEVERSQALIGDAPASALGPAGTSPQSSLHEEDVLISAKTGRREKVMVYTDPKTGLISHPDAGWSYNPGAVDWTPDWGKYPAGMKDLVDEVKAEVETVIAGVPKPVFVTIGQRSKLRGYADNSFSETPDAINKIVNKVKDGPKYTSGAGWRSYYQRGYTDKIHIGADHIRDARHDTMRHEIGHLVDYRVRNIDPSYEVRISIGDRFRRAVDADLAALKSDVERRRRIQGDVARGVGSKFKDDLFTWDTFGSLTWNWGTSRVGGGHAYSYYLRDPSHREGEIFANLFTIYSRVEKTAWRYIKEELPEIAGAFEEIIRDLAGKL